MSSEYHQHWAAGETIGVVNKLLWEHNTDDACHHKLACLRLWLDQPAHMQLARAA